jgi:hypothetical protein
LYKAAELNAKGTTLRIFITIPYIVQEQDVLFVAIHKGPHCRVPIQGMLTHSKKVGV